MTDYADRCWATSPGADYTPDDRSRPCRAGSRSIPTTTPSSGPGQGAGQGGQARRRQGQDADRKLDTGRRDHRPVPAVVEGLRLRPAARRRADKADHIYIPAESAGDASSGDEVAVKIVKKSQARGDERRGPDRPGRRPGLAASSSAPTSRRAASASSRSTARPSTTRSTSATPAPRGPSPATRSPSRSSAIPRPYQEGRGGHHRDPRPARRAGRRHADGHPGVQHPRRLRRRGPRRGPRAGQALQRGRRRRPPRPPRRPDRHHRPRHRPRLRRRDLPRARRAGLLDPRRPHRRRLPLRRAELGARPRGPQARHQRLPARPRHPDAAGDPLQQPGQPPGGPHAVHGERPSWSSTTTASAPEAVRPIGDPGRPSIRLRGGVRGHEGTRERTRGGRARGPRRCSRTCSSWR